MNEPLKLKPYLGSEKTLVISSSYFAFEKHEKLHDKIFVHLLPGSRLLRYDPQQREMLEEHIEAKLCSQLIFVGSKDQQLMDQIQADDSLNSLKSAFKFNLKPLLRAKHEKAIDPAVKMQMLIEFNVINQCKLLMDYFFIKEKVENNKLQVKGVVTELKSDQLKSIFRNGIVYNDLLTLN
jgi:hypothetical protein